MENLLYNLPDDVRIKIISELLPFDERLRIIETLVELYKNDTVLTSVNQLKQFFDIYISKNCFNDSEFKKIKNSGKYYALNGCFNLLKLSLLFDPDYKLTKNTCANAAKAGRLDILKWCKELGRPLNTWTCAYAAEGGRLDILKWCRDQKPKCPWDKNTCAFAAKGGHLKVLKWCIENGCPWDKNTCANAAKNGHLNILEWCSNLRYKFCYKDT